MLGCCHVHLRHQFDNYSSDIRYLKSFLRLITSQYISCCNVNLLELLLIKKRTLFHSTVH
jgi:hypothetical protein